jgi:hypothetical protein
MPTLILISVGDLDELEFAAVELLLPPLLPLLLHAASARLTRASAATAALRAARLRWMFEFRATLPPKKSDT